MEISRRRRKVCQAGFGENEYYKYEIRGSIFNLIRWVMSKFYKFFNDSFEETTENIHIIYMHLFILSHHNIKI